MFCQEPCQVFKQNESKWEFCVLSSLHVALMSRASLPNYGRRFTNCFQKQMGGQKKGLHFKCKWKRKLSSAKQRKCSSNVSETGTSSHRGRGIQGCFAAETARKHPAFRFPGLLQSFQNKNDKQYDLLKNIWGTLSCSNPVGCTQTWKIGHCILIL